jgi:hypothetical protein
MTKGGDGDADRVGGHAGGRGPRAGRLPISRRPFPRRWVGAFVLALVASLAAPPHVEAVSPPPSPLAPGLATVSQELLVVVRHGTSLAVFEEARFNPHEPDRVLGLLSGASQVRAIDGAVSPFSGNRVRVAGTSRSITIEYRLPWDGRRTVETLAGAGTIDDLSLYLGPGLELSQAANPSWSYDGLARILPGVATDFATYVTTGVHAGETLDITWQPGSAVPAAAAPAPAHPAASGAGDVVLALMGLLAGGSWGLLYWRISRVRQAVSRAKEAGADAMAR